MKQKTVIGALGIIEKNGQILMALRHDPENPPLHNLWEFPGGGMYFNETPGEALKREVLEEVGVRIKIISMVPYPLVQYIYKLGTKLKIIFFAFNCQITSGIPKPSNIETVKIRWCLLKDIKPVECTPFTKDLVENMLKLKSC